MTEVETVRRYISRCSNELECYSLVSINNVERIIIDGSQIVISKKWIKLTSNESQFTVVETVRMYIMDAAITWGFIFICLRHWEVISQDQTYVNVRWKLKKNRVSSKLVILISIDYFDVYLQTKVWLIGTFARGHHFNDN